jgi:transposase
LTAGQRGDAPVFPALLGAVPAGAAVRYGVADAVYDSDAIRALLRGRGAEAVIPSNPTRQEPVGHDAEVYRQRNRVERLVGKLKQFRRMATRYEKLSETYLALIHLVAAFIKFR